MTRGESNELWQSHNWLNPIAKTNEEAYAKTLELYKEYGATKAMCVRIPVVGDFNSLYGRVWVDQKTGNQYVFERKRRDSLSYGYRDSGVIQRQNCNGKIVEINHYGIQTYLEAEIKYILLSQYGEVGRVCGNAYYLPNAKDIKVEVLLYEDQPASLTLTWPKTNSPEFKLDLIEYLTSP